MLRDKNKDEEVTPYSESYYGEAPVEEVALEDLEPVEKPVIVEEVVVPVVDEPLLSDAERDTAVAWEIVAKLRATEAAKKNKIANEDVSAGKIAAMEVRKAELAKKIEALYTVNVGGWNGLDNYECTVCPYSTLDVNLIKVHVRQHV